jgi:O-methyltransferase involved in polyketide biosynthesis
LSRRYGHLDFQCLDLREPLPLGRSVLLVDVLHYFTEDEQAHLLHTIAATVPAGGMVIIRDAIRDGTWRYRLTHLQEVFARITGWTRSERLSFPTREQIERPFQNAGFTADVSPLWGKTPFNNYLFVFKRPFSGTTNA